MFGLEVVIYDDRWPDIDIVSELYSQANRDSLPLEEVDRHILERTLAGLDSRETRDIFGRRFLNGGIDAKVLLGCGDYYGIIEKLVFGKVDYADLGLKLELEIKAPVTASDYPELYNALLGLEKVQSDPGVERSKFDKQVHYHLLKLFLKDLSEIEEQASYGRVKFFGEYFHNLMQKSQDKRYTFIEKMINRGYPFSDENREKWRTYFHTE